MAIMKSFNEDQHSQKRNKWNKTNLTKKILKMDCEESGHTKIL